MSEGSIEREGFKLHYCVEGDGPPALVIGSSRYYPRSFSQSLRRHLRLVFLDWRGFAEGAASNLTLELLLEDIDSIREALGLERCIVIGHSAHALLALEYGKKYPEHTSHIAMIATYPDLSPATAAATELYWQESVWPARKAALEERTRQLPDEELAKLPPAEGFIAWYVRRDPQAWYDYTINSSKLWKGVVPNMPLFDFLYRTVLPNLDISTGLEKLTQPVFLALGRYDFIAAPPSVWDPLRPKFHDLTVRVFEHSGHSPQLEEAELFDEELLKWLGPVA